jgi:hypothetical protein
MTFSVPPTIKSSLRMSDGEKILRLRIYSNTKAVPTRRRIFQPLARQTMEELNLRQSAEINWLRRLHSISPGIDYPLV